MAFYILVSTVIMHFSAENSVTTEVYSMWKSDNFGSLPNVSEHSE